MRSMKFSSLVVISAFCCYVQAEENNEAKSDVQKDIAAVDVEDENNVVAPTAKTVSEQQPEVITEKDAASANETEKSESSVDVNENAAPVSVEQPSEQPEAVQVKDVDKGPQISQIFPEIGWNRCMADTASSITQWKRWWQYLKMKEPVVMNWIDGLKIKIYPKNEVFRSVYVNGKYDPNMVVILKAFLKPGNTLIDVGANCGYISLPLISTLGSNGKVIAIEPSTRDYKRLVENVDINKLAAIVKPIKLAMGDRVGSKTMLIASEERSNANTLGPRFAFQGIEKETTEEVNVTTIDNIVNMENLAKVDIIKLDVEGSEARCLEGAKDTIAKFKPIIVISVNKDALSHSKRSVEDIEKILKENGYGAYGLEKNRFALRKLEGLSKLYAPIVVCLPNGVEPIDLPKPENLGFLDKIKNFFK